jgi:Ca2+-binding RTX toxin-like protein
MAVITGTALDDVLTTTGSADAVSALAGNDLILIDASAAHAVGETIIGGTGGDRIWFTSTTGGETLTLRSGVTQVETVVLADAAGGTSGTTNLSLDAGAVLVGLSLLGNDGDNTLTGTAGSDVISGQGGLDFILAGAGNDRVILRVDEATLDGADAGVAAEGNTLVLVGTAAGVVVVDLSLGSNVDQLLSIGAVAEAATQSDFSHLNASDVTGAGVLVAGSALANTIIGTMAEDTLAGAAGSDILSGGVGNDVFLVASGADHATTEIISGGAGDDVIRFSALTAQTLTLRAGVSGVEAVEIADEAGVTTGTTALNVSAAAVRNALALTGNDGNNSVGGTTLDDTINGNAGSDTLRGGAGNDRYVVDAGADSSATDRIADTSGTEDYLVFTSTTGGETLTIGALVTGIDGVYLSDIDLVTTGTDALNVDAALATVALKIHGNDGDNTLIGGRGADTFQGNGGTDTIVGGLGADQVIMDAAALDDADAGAASEGNTLRLTGTAAAQMLVDLSVAADADQVVGGGVQADFTHVDASELQGEGLTVTASAVANRLVGSDLDDIFVYTTTSHFTNDSINGGTAETVDILRFASTTAGQALVLTTRVVDVEKVEIADAAGVTTGTTTLHVNAAALATGISIVGNDGINALTGGRGDDTLNGNAGLDTLVGGLGNDVYEFDSYADYSNGVTRDRITESGGTADKILFSDTMDGGMLILGALAGVELFEIGGTASTGIDAGALTSAGSFIGNDGDNTLIGGAGRDTIEGGLGADSIEGRGGADRIVMNLDGPADEINAGAITEGNTLVLKTPTTTSHFVIVDLSITAGGDQVSYGADGATQSGFTHVDASLMVTDSISGGGIAVLGDSRANFIVGSAGDDLFQGGLGRDTIEGGAGADSFYVNSQAEYDGDIYRDSGGTPDDSIVFASTVDGATLLIRNNVFGVDGADAGGTANLNIDARAVNQPFGLAGNNGDNRLWGTRHGESFFIHDGVDYVAGGGGRDDYVILSHAGWQAAGIGHDTIVDTGRENHFYFADRFSSDTLVVGPYVTGMGIFVISSGALATGGPFVRDNTLTNNAGLDVSAILYGVVLAGNNGSNVLVATRGNDTIEGYGGSDTITGGLGNDRVTMDVSGDAIDQIDAGAITEANVLLLKGGASDVLRFDLASTTDQITGIGAAGEARTQTGFRHVDASALTDFGVVVFGSAHANTLTGSALDDVLEGGAGLDVVNAGAGNDAILLRALSHQVLNERADGGAGEDAVWFASTTAGETLRINPVYFRNIEALVLADETGATTGTTALHIDATLFRTDMKLTGNDGANRLTGTVRNDVLTGNGGIDTLMGGAGNDAYLYEAPADMDAAERIFDASGTDDGIRFVSTTNGEMLVLAADLTGVEYAELGDAAGSLTGIETTGLDASAVTRALILRGNAGDNTLIGGTGDDRIFGNGGNDTIAGGLGADQIHTSIEDASRDDIDAGAAAEGNALVVTGAATGEMVWDLSSAADQLVSINGASDGNTIAGIAHLDLSQVTGGAATVTGSAEVNRIVGTALDDTFIVLAQAHFVAGESIDGNEGDDDRILFTSTAAGETLTLSNSVIGIEAVLLADATGDTSGTTNLNVNAAAVGNGLEIEGNDGDNVITGTARNDTIVGGAGSDTINAGAGTDKVITDVADEDAITAGVLAENNEWVLQGAAGALLVIDLSLTGDQLATGTLVQSGFTHLDASGVTAFGAQITGSAAANRIAGTAEQDTIAGGAGADRISMDVTSSFDAIDAGALAEGNELVLTGTAPGLMTVDLSILGDQVATGTLVQSGFLHLDASGMTGAALDVTGSAAANRITGTAMQDTIVAGAGADIVTMDVSGSFDAIDAGAGSEGDVLRLVGTASDELVVDLGVSPGGDQLTNVGAAAEAVVQSDFQHVDASALLAFGVDVRGSAANNVLTGTAMADRIAGLGGSDTVDAGSDSLSDTIVYESVSDGVNGAAAAFSRDRVLNFVSGTDKVEFAAQFNGGAGNLDDINGNDAFEFAVDERAKLSESHEALFVSASKARLASDALLYSGSFATVAAAINRVGVTSVAGDDGLIVVQGRTQTGVYYYQELSGAGVSGGELTLLGVFDGHLDSADFILG